MAIKFNFVPWKGQSAVEKKLIEVQQSLIQMQLILAAADVTTSSAGNPYKNYESATCELGRKYEGVADWGNFQARTIIDVRAAFMMGSGLQVMEQNPETMETTREFTGKYQKEIDFIKGFLQINKIAEAGAMRYAREAEIEGRSLFKLIPNKEKSQIELRFLSYTSLKYEVTSHAEDYKQYEKVVYKLKDGIEVTIPAPDFVYKKFAGREDKVNDVMSKTATVLRLVEDLDKALRDLRQINNLFASPTPYFNCEDQTSADSLYKKLKDINWKIGKMIVGWKAEFSLVGVDGAGAESIVKEITNLVKMISGTTGIPVHFLGLPDLMSNRSTSSDLFEMIMASTNAERLTWVEAYEEMFNKAMQIANDKFGLGLTLNTVSCDIPQITGEKIKELADVWLPLYTADVIDINYFLSKIPDADPAAIKKAQEKKMKDLLAEVKAGADNPNDPNNPGAGGPAGGGAY